MKTVALIGADGAGKTSVAQYVLETAPFPVRYIYMGISLQSANHQLPTSRLIIAVRRWMHRRRSEGDVDLSAVRIPAIESEYSSRKRPALWVAARLLNRYLEAWYRQAIATYHGLLGRVVVFDRHLLFDTGLLRPYAGDSLLHRAYRRAMDSFPRPGLIVFIDAPGEVLHARSGDASPARLDEERRLYASQAEAARQFVTIDATKPLEDVQHQAMLAIIEWLDAPAERAQ